MFRNNHASSQGSNNKKRGFSVTTILLLMTSNGISFFAGTLFAFNAGINKCGSSSSTSQANAVTSLRSLEREGASSGGRSPELFPPEVHRFAVGMANTKKEDFTSNFELGVPLDLPKEGEENVLILYSKHGAMPKKMQKSKPSTIELLSTKEAVENCDYLNMIFTHHSGDRNQCLAILPQYVCCFLILCMNPNLCSPSVLCRAHLSVSLPCKLLLLKESYHIQKWMRVPPTGHGELDSAYDLQLVSRGYQANG